MGYDSANGYVGIGRQTVQGTGVAPTDFIRFLTGASTPVNELQTTREGGNDRTGATVEKVGMQFPFSFDCWGRPDIAGLLFTMLLGSDTISGAGPYTHTIIPAALMWWSVEMQKVGGLNPNEIVDRLEDSKINALTFSAAAGENLRIAVEGQGLVVDSSNSAASDTYGTEAILKFLHGTFTAFGGATTEITEFSLTITNNLEPIQTSAITYAQLVELALEVTLEFTLKVTADDEFRKVYYGGSAGTAASEDLEATQVNFVFNNGEAGGAEREIGFTIPEFAYEMAELTPLNAEPEVMYYACSGVARKASGSELITVVTKDNVATAYDGA